MRKVDVLVLGAGISGCIAALLLARKGYKVEIISRDIGTIYHLPESWVYDLPEEIVDLEDKLLSGVKKQSNCTFCSSDNQHCIEIVVKGKKDSIQKGDLVWVDRNHFDQILLQAALEQGVQLHPLSSIVDCQISPTEVNLHVESQGKLDEFVGSYIIDATGKSAFLSQHLGLPVKERKLDSRIAYFSHFDLDLSDELKEIKIVHTEGGYLFCFPLSGRRVSIGCVLAESVPYLQGSLEEVFSSAISSSSYLTDLVSRSKRVFPIIPAKNTQRICLKPSGSRYRLIGDAAAFLDPFFCPGIDFAFFSAKKAVESIEKDSDATYEADVIDWLGRSILSVYNKIERSDWHEIVRLFADPHLPFVVPLMLTQSFGQLIKKDHSLKEGVELARSAYEMASC